MDGILFARIGSIHHRTTEMLGGRCLLLRRPAGSTCMACPTKLPSLLMDTRSTTSIWRAPAGHFALETHAKEIAALMRDFIPADSSIGALALAHCVPTSSSIKL